MKKFGLVFFFGCILISTNIYSQQQEISKYNVVTKIYKTIDTTKLSMKIYYPENFNPKNKYPAMVFFFGGGWVTGSISQFKPQAEYFVSRGMITVLADYRIKKRNNTSPFDAARDAKSAVRYLRQNAKTLGIDPTKIAAAGGSAGGHLAAVTGNIIGLEEPNENLAISSKANALVLFNPVFDNGPTGFGFEEVGGEAHYKEISPIHNIRKDAPPTIVFFGTKDIHVPVSTAQDYKKKMEAVGSQCELYLYEGKEHGFFNYKGKNGDNSTYNDILEKIDKFLTTLKYLNPKK